MPVFPPGIRVAKGAWIGRGVEFDWSYGYLIEIRDRVTIAQGARLLCHDSSSQARLGVTWVAPITIGEGAFVGVEALIMPGVTVGEGAVVAARAVVADDVEPGTVVAGVPARLLCTVAELDERRVAQMQRIGCLDLNAAADPGEGLAALRAHAERHGGFFVAEPEVAARYQQQGDVRP